MFTPVTPMIRLHAELRDAGFPPTSFPIPTLLPCRTSASCSRSFKPRTSTDTFCPMNMVAMKTDPRLYEVVEEMAGYRGTDLLYLDDRPENIAVAGQPPLADDSAGLTEKTIDVFFGRPESWVENSPKPNLMNGGFIGRVQIFRSILPRFLLRGASGQRAGCGIAYASNCLRSSDRGLERFGLPQDLNHPVCSPGTLKR